MVPSTIIGGLLILRSSMFIKNDLSLVVAELREELDEHERQQADPEQIPALQVNDIDFSYGHVQVLFDVGFEVRKGEVLALLGTNGAGKSTILRVIAGLGTPARGRRPAPRPDRSPTCRPRSGAGMGIRLLPGGKGVFPQMTVRENLEMAAFVYRSDRADQERRIARVLDLFDDLAEPPGPERGVAVGRPAADARPGRASLLHEPEVLLIDELSLGLSPIVVQQLLGVVERLKGEGMTIVIVEQSLNVALAMADRAVFLEKGQVRFEGDAQRAARARRPRPGRVPRAARAADARCSLPRWFTRQLVFDGLITGWCSGSGDGHRARLPVDPGHQLRRRQPRPRRRRPLRAARRRSTTCRSGSRPSIGLVGRHRSTARSSS